MVYLQRWRYLIASFSTIKLQIHRFANSFAAFYLLSPQPVFPFFSREFLLFREIKLWSIYFKRISTEILLN